MLPAVLVWIVGSILLIGIVATVAVVYAALKIAARTDAIIGECKLDAGNQWDGLCPSVGPGSYRRQWRMPHFPHSAST